jgi:hypothetical protein
MKTESTLHSNKVSSAKSRCWWKPVAGVSLVASILVYGVGVRYYQWPVFWQIQVALATLTQLLP